MSERVSSASPELQRLGIRIERPENATWATHDRTALRNQMRELFGVTQIGINANQPEAEMSVPAEMAKRIDGTAIEGVGTLVVDSTVVWSPAWKHPSLNEEPQST